MQWYHIPVVVLERYAREMDRLSAEEEIKSVNVIGLGTGSLKSKDMRRLHSIMMERAGIEHKARKPTVGQLEMMGIKVERGNG